MKIKGSLVFVLILISVFASAQKFQSSRRTSKVLEFNQSLKSTSIIKTDNSVVFEESFEGDVGQWFYINNDGDDFNWDVYNEDDEFDFARTGSSGAGSYFNATGSDDWLVSPQIVLPENVESLEFSLWAHSHSADYLESFNVKLSTSEAEMTDFTVTLDNVINVPSTWTQYSFDLTAYQGKSIFIAIQHVSVNMWYLMVDDLLITSIEGTTDNWDDQHSAVYNSSEAEIVVRTGDIDNLGFGWAQGFDPFSGFETSSHVFPWTTKEEDAEGTDRIMVVSSYDGNPPSGSDGYTSSTSRPANNPVPISMSYDLKDVSVSSAVFQIFLDDFQASYWGASYQVKLDGVRIPLWESVINSLSQTGPIGKLVSFNVPSQFLEYLNDGEVELFIDDPTTGAGDGFAIDFVRLLINPGSFSYTGIINGVVKNKETGQVIQGASVTAAGIVTDNTNSDGEFNLADVPAGVNYIEITAEGYSSATAVVDLESEETEFIEIQMAAVEVVDVPNVLTTSYGPPENANEWVKYSIPLVAESFGLDEATFKESMKSIGLIRIRTEMRDGDDKGSIDEVSMGNMFSSFDTSSDGWGVMGDGTLGYESSGGYDGGYITIDDWASGDWHWAVAPDSWTGDLSSLIGTNFEFYFKTTHPSYSAVIEFHTVTSNRIVLTADKLSLSAGSKIEVHAKLIPAPSEQITVDLSSSSSLLSVPNSVGVGINGIVSFDISVADDITSISTSVITASASNFSSGRLTFTLNPKSDFYESTVDGGFWHNPEAWVGGEVPPAESNVMINGPISIFTRSNMGGIVVSDLTVSGNGILQVESTDGDFDSGMAGADILGQLTVHGTLKNYDGILILNVSGDVFNYGNVENIFLNLDGEKEQTLLMSDEAVFNGTRFADNDVESNVTIASDMVFIECNLSFHGVRVGNNTPGNLLLPEGFKVTLKNSNIVNTNIVGAGNKIESIGNSKFYELNSISNVILSGDYEVDGTTTFKGESVVLEGTLIGGNYQDTIFSKASSFFNYGRIPDNSFIFNIEGNVYSNGVWKNKNTFICGVDEQDVEFVNYSGNAFQIVANVASASNFQWELNGAELYGENNEMLELASIDVSNNGIYTVLTDKGESRNVTVTVDTPELAAGFTADVTSGPAPLTVQFTDMSEGNPTAWKWFVDYGEGVAYYKAGDQNPLLDFNSAGSYGIMLIVTRDSKTDTIMKENYIVVEKETGIFNPKNKNLSFYPNPIKDYLNISVVDLIASEGVVSIQDLSGKSCLKLNLSNTSDEIRLDVAKLSKGIYILEIVSESKVYRSKFVKE